MNTLCIKETEDTPLIHYDPNSGIFKIEGNSIPENAYLFYDPVLIWLDKYIENPKEKIEFIFQMKMISSSSSKMFFDILNKIDALNENTSSEVKVTWLYSIYDDEIREIGLDYRDFINVPFEIVLADSE